MIIGVAQTRSVKGDVWQNLEDHQRWIDRAVSAGAHMLIFPELSLTGYEPELAGQLVTGTGRATSDKSRR